MVLRIILALMLAAFVIPGMAAACHDAPTRAVAATLHQGAAHHGMAHDAPVEHDAAVKSHLCVGCVPPSNWKPAALAQPLPFAVLRGSRVAAALVVGTPPAPETPPPRGRG